MAVDSVARGCVLARLARGQAQGGQAIRAPPPSSRARAKRILPARLYACVARERRPGACAVPAARRARLSPRRRAGPHPGTRQPRRLRRSSTAQTIPGNLTLLPPPKRPPLPQGHGMVVGRTPTSRENGRWLRRPVELPESAASARKAVAAALTRTVSAPIEPFNFNRRRDRLANEANRSASRLPCHSDRESWMRPAHAAGFVRPGASTLSNGTTAIWSRETVVVAVTRFPPGDRSA